ncbi:GPP34 family phosphoprotein [Aeromicrobium sp. CTD01-1L150]|uniref:GOLPH3/VPS74 family protein n=1 Tax=Aeromicrobium sp. CTD01-1L150 TaxID=3341830 RepID=UPI0035C1804E
MTVSQDLLLIALDPVKGTVRIPSTKSNPLLGGAALLELATLGHVAFEEERRKPRVVVADHSPASDPVLEAAFARIRHKGRQTPKSAVARLGKKQRRAVLASMERAGLVDDRGETFLGVRLERYELLDAAHRDDLLTRLRAILLQGLPADDTTGPLVGLLLAGDLLGIVVERADKKQAKARAKAVADGDWASDGVRQAIASAEAAMAAVVIGAGAAGASGS